MLAKILGLIDLLGIIAIVLLFLGVGEKFAIFMAILIIIKSLVFITAFASWVDLVMGGIIIVSVIYGRSVFLIIALIWLLQKAILSLFSY